MPQNRRLPPIKSLQTFEVAARSLSFSNAADELCVTPAAVSQQIKQLETYLGIPLFHRTKKNVQLTDEAAAVLPLLSESFDKLEEAVNRLARERWAGRLTVSSVPTFSIKWLVHNLAGFTRAHPEIDVRLDASVEFRDFQRDEIDVSIRFGLGNYPDLHVTRLFGEEFILICSPALLEGDQPLRTPHDLKHHRILHVDWGGLNSRSGEWHDWAKAAGVEGLDFEKGSRFTYESMAIEAAIHGNGVALVSYYAVLEELKSGRLVQPFDIKVESELAYWLVCPELHLRREKVKAFCDWILTETENVRI